MKRRLEDSGLCLRTRKRLKALEYKGTATIKDLPIEVVWKILDYLDDNSFFNLRNQCNSLSIAQTVVFYHLCNTVPYKIFSTRKNLFNRLYSYSFEEEFRRLDITKSLLYLDWLETEFMTLVGILWRYNVNAECIIFNKLWSIVKEMLNRIDSLMNSVPFSEVIADIRVLNPSSSLPLWTKFIEDFDEVIEPTLGIPIPFETRVIDILTSCPSSNLQIVFNRSLHDDTVGFKAFCQIQDSCSERNQPVITGESDPDYEKAILRYLRFTVRMRNTLIASNLFDDIKNLECRLFSNFLNEDDRNRIVLLLEDKYRHLMSSLYEPLISFNGVKNWKYFVRRSTNNVSNNFLECFLEKNHLNISDVPLIIVCPHIFKAVKTENTPNMFQKIENTENENAFECDIIEIPIDKPFKLAVIFKRWWEELNISVTRDHPQENQISFTVVEHIEPCCRINEEQ